MSSKDMGSGYRILVVDGPTETEQVLRTILEPQGLQVDRVRDTDIGVKNSEMKSPSVVVIHDQGPTKTLLRLKKWPGVPHVIIGSVDYPSSVLRAANGRYLQKPFHYGELIRVIELLLDDSTSEPCTT